MTVQIVSEAFDPWATLSDYTSKHAGTLGSYGATGIFVGTMRDFNEGCRIDTMELEHYPGMTEKALDAVEQEARDRWTLTGSLVIHRVGPLLPNDRIVFVAAASAHRKEAFSACEFMIDALKTRAPFWKKETTPAGNRWVEAPEDN